LRGATPVARYGNLFIYRGTFHLPGLLASDSYWAATSKLFAEKPDLAEAERLFRQSVQLDPGAYFVYIDLGNLALARGAREEALSEYQTALRYSANKTLSQPIEEQIRRLSQANAASEVPALRDPMME
jgi:thioredoxin-like negative regulator of GroEL